MKPEMHYSGTGLALTENFEGCSLAAYKHAGGVRTNGDGNTHGVEPGSTITQQQAAADLSANIQSSVNDVDLLVAVALTEGEFDALVDFDFNLGRENLANSTLLSAAAPCTAWAPHGRGDQRTARHHPGHGAGAAACAFQICLPPVRTPR